MRGCAFVVLLLTALPVPGQSERPAQSRPVSAASSNASEVARLFGLEADLLSLHELQTSRGSGPVTLDEVVLRQRIVEKVQAASLDVDSAIAELSNEQSDLGTVKTELQAKRDKKVGHLTTAALLTGSALGAAVSATQFSALGSRTANVGDGVGIGSGAASTLLSVLAAKAQAGPSGAVGETPNMLSPLLGEGSPRLNTYYAPAVLAYLNAAPVGADDREGSSRLQQLMAGWEKAGRLKNRAALTATGDTPRVSIEDLTNRIAMLGDVRGRISLVKRDLALLLRGTMPGQ